MHPDIDRIAKIIHRTPVCKLCQRIAPLTDEDIMPMWERRRLMRQLGPYPPGKAPKRLKVRICHACNSTMGRLFENQAEAIMSPLFEGKKCHLPVDRQVQISTWITKTSMLGALASTSPGVWGHAEAGAILREMLESGIPPRRTSVRIARMDRRDTHKENGVKHLLPPTQVPRFHFYSLSVSQNLYWEMFIGENDSILPYVAWCRTHLSHFATIWPPTEPIAWPPACGVTPNQINEMRKIVLGKRVHIDSLADPWHRRWDAPGHSDSLH